MLKNSLKKYLNLKKPLKISLTTLILSSHWKWKFQLILTWQMIQSILFSLFLII